MKRRMRLALWLYPPAWRERYAREFEALLEDVRPGWRECWDVARGGLKMRLLRWNLVSVTMACALLGAAIGGGWSLGVPDRYVSTAVIRIADDAKAQDLQRAQAEIFSRHSMAELIVREDLFHDERQKEPFEDVISEVRNKHIRLQPLARPADGNRGFPSAVAISFEYHDREKARNFTRVVSERLAAAVPSIQVLDAASLPQRPISPNRLAFTLVGLTIGIAAGVLAVAARSRSLTRSPTGGSRPRS